MHDPSSPARRPDPPIHRGAHAVAGYLLIAVAAAAAGALAAGVVFVLIRIVGAIAAFVAANWPQIVAVLVFALVVVGVGLIYEAMRRYEARQRAARLREIAHLDRVDVMSGSDFEELTAELLRRDDYRWVKVVGRTGDRGVDVLATADDGGKIAVQCKRQQSKVTPAQVRNLIGAIHATYPGHTGLFVTNNTFTKQALDEADGHLILLDRARLSRWMDGDPLTI